MNLWTTGGSSTEPATRTRRVWIGHRVIHTPEDAAGPELLDIPKVVHNPQHLQLPIL